jgi:hypothetical protein
MSSLVVLYLSSHYQFVLLPHYELVHPRASVGYVQTISSDVARASPQLVSPLVSCVCKKNLLAPLFIFAFAVTCRRCSYALAVVMGSSSTSLGPVPVLRYPMLFDGTNYRD